MAKSPPISLKPGAERLALIDAYATDHGLTRHGALLALLDEGLERVNGPKTQEPQPRGAGPAKAALAAKGLPADVASNIPVKDGVLSAPRGDTYPSWMRGKPKEGKK